MFYEGRGVSKDFKESAQYFIRAANQGCTDAQAVLGAMYYEGQGVVKNYREAIKWFKRSAQQGNRESQRYLHVLCFERPSACR